MTQEKHAHDDHVMDSNDLAFERTAMAESRTLMAWIRTAISLISFGFTIYKFFHEIEGSRNTIFSPRHVGMVMIAFGLLSLFWGLMEHRATIKKLKKSYPRLEPSRSSTLAILILFFGLAMFLATLLRM